MRMVQFQRIYFNFFFQKRKQLHADRKFFHVREWLRALEARVFCNYGVAHLKRWREQAQFHLAQSHGASQPLFQLRLNLRVILVDINYMWHDQRCSHQNNHDNQYRYTQLTHNDTSRRGPQGT